MQINEYTHVIAAGGNVYASEMGGIEAAVLQSLEQLRLCLIGFQIQTPRIDTDLRQYLGTALLLADSQPSDENLKRIKRELGSTLSHYGQWYLLVTPFETPPHLAALARLRAAREAASG